MALRTSTQVMSAIWSVLGSGAVRGLVAIVSAMALDASVTSASFTRARRRGDVMGSALDMSVSSRRKAGGAPLWALMLSRALIPDLRPLSRRRGTELRAPLRRHGGARHLLAPQIDLVDAAGVADLLQRIGVEHDEVGIAAGRDQPGIDLGNISRIARRRDDGLRRRHAHGGVAFERRMVEETDQMAGLPGVGAHHHLHAGRPQRHGVLRLQLELMRVEAYARAELLAPVLLDRERRI